MMAMVVEVKVDEKVDKEANKQVKEMKEEVEGVEDCTSASILDVYQQMCAEQSLGYFHVNVAEEF